MESVQIITCVSCNKKLVYSDEDTLKEHYEKNPMCLLWENELKNSNNGKLIQDIIEIQKNLLDSKNDTRIICKGCNISYSNIGNINKHFRNKPECMKFHYYNSIKKYEIIDNKYRNLDNNEYKMSDLFVEFFNLCSRTTLSQKNIENIENYYLGWPFSGEYIKDLEWAHDISIKYLISMKHITDGVCVFDFDNTVVFDDPEKKIGIREMELGIHNDQPVFILPINNPIVKIMQFIKSLKFKIVILTARPLDSVQAIIYNLNMFNVPYDFICNIPEDIDSHEYKNNFILKHVNKYGTLLYTIGDLPYDCYKPFSIKLPSPENKCSYCYTTDTDIVKSFS